MIVLTNAIRMWGTPYLEMWNRAVAESGACVTELTLRHLIRARRRGPTVVHIQWPERAVTDPRLRVALRRIAALICRCAFASRVLDTPVMVTGHNVWSHDRRHPLLERFLWSVLSWVTTDLHLLSSAGEEEFLDAHPGLGRARRHVIPHGDFRPVVEPGKGRGATRARLGLAPDAMTFLTFGALKSYKGTIDLLDSFSRLTDDTARLVVAGRIMDQALRNRLVELEGSDPRIIVLRGFTADAELMDLIRASDIVVLPYRQVLNSGSALLALTLDRPIILPDTPTFAELSARTGPGWVHLFEDTISDSDLACPRPHPAAHGSPDLSWCSWPVIVQQLQELWAKLGAGCIDAARP